MVQQAPAKLLALRGQSIVADDVESQILEVRVLDPKDEGRVSLVVQDGDTLVARPHLEFCRNRDPDDGVTVLDGRRMAVSRFGPYPIDARVEMFIRMEGYRSPVMGSETFGPMDAMGVRLAEIRPTKGWSARIHVYEADREKSLRPLEGIVLSFDGHATQSTDQAGFVYAEADQAPSRIDVLTPGWELVDRSSWTEWGSVVAAERAFTVEDGRLTVHLRAR